MAPMASGSKYKYEDDIDALLNSEASEVMREKEMFRVLSAFKLNPYEVLDIQLTATTDPDSINALVKKAYRQKSLLLHPDKLKHARGPESFDMLKKAEGELSDSEKRAVLDQLITDARMLVLRALSPPLKPETPDSHATLRRLDPPLPEQIRKKTKELLIDEELRKRRGVKMTMIAEGADAKKKEDEANEKARDKEVKRKWEDTREVRVADWRNFSSGGTKKKKVSHKALG